MGELEGSKRVNDLAEKAEGLDLIVPVETFLLMASLEHLVVLRPRTSRRTSLEHNLRYK